MSLRPAEQRVITQTPAPVLHIVIWSRRKNFLFFWTEQSLTYDVKTLCGGLYSCLYLLSFKIVIILISWRSSSLTMITFLSCGKKFLARAVDNVQCRIVETRRSCCSRLIPLLLEEQVPFLRLFYWCLNSNRTFGEGAVVARWIDSLCIISCSPGDTIDTKEQNVLKLLYFDLAPKLHEAVKQRVFICLIALFIAYIFIQK